MPVRYGLEWEDGCDDASIERRMLQRGGSLHGCGHGLLFHFEKYAKALWPEDAQTRWTRLIYEEVLEHQFTSIVGPASSWKTGTIARLALMDWSLFPDYTYIIVSSTDMDGLQARVFGELARLWARANERFEWFPGHVVDHKSAITFESVDDDTVRDMRNSIIGVPCRSAHGRFLGLGKYSGRKNRRVWCISDECQFMERSFLDAQENLISNGENLVQGLYPMTYPEVSERGKPLRGFKAVFLGNPNPTRPENPLHLISEPIHGWNALANDGKTKCYDARQVPGSVVKARVVMLDGRDSPNNDYPYGQPRWPHLIHAARLDKYAKDSESYWSQGVGFVMLGLAGLKIITKELCEQFHAFDEVIWKGERPTIKVGALDAAYGGVGGDRCICMWGEFGECVDGIWRLMVKGTIPVPVKIMRKKTPEDQIAEFCKEQMQIAGVLPENFFFDGRGGVALSFARIWSNQVNVIEFGGRPTDRPIGNGVDAMVTDEYGRKRPKLAWEFYSKFVTELWWSGRLAVEADQIRGLTEEIVYDGQPREWYKVAGDRTEIETKKEMKKRTGESPDIFDAFVTLLEGARRRGFVIQALGDKAQIGLDRKYEWLEEMATEQREIKRSHVLQMA